MGIYNFKTFLRVISRTVAWDDRRKQDGTVT